MVYSFIIEPETFSAFEDEEALIDQCKEWGLLTEKASKIKSFSYKGNGLNLTCSIIGFVDKITAVIEFDNKQKHCIHPSYLKEMQASSFSQRISASAEDPAEADDATSETLLAETSAVDEFFIEEPKAEQPAEEIPNAEQPQADPAKAEQPKAEQPPKEKAKKQKLQLPEEKVKLTATVSEFTTVPNHFSDTDDEVVIYEAVSMTEPETEIGFAWSSYSATLKKLELKVGDAVTFEAKIVAKKLTKHPVPFKINNPAKIQKKES